MINKDEFWAGVTQYFKEILSETSFNNWVAPVKPTRITDNTITLSVPNNLLKQQWEKNLSGYIIQFSIEHYGFELTPIFIVVGAVSPDNFLVNTLQNDIEIHNVTPANSNLNPSYTFDTFVVGEENKMANGAALAVCDNPGKTYNPFLIYGGVGLGKTHLMQAIGNEIKRNNPAARIKYVTTETFMNEYVSSITYNTTEKFKRMYRDDIDVLLIDDIQFFSNKNRIQEEFFHTFNALFNAGKQIVLTCDRLPNNIDNLEDRLISRFKWGLSTDITPPDLETRIAILRRKALNDNLDIPSEALTYIANNVDSNIRELEGALTRVLAYAAMNGEEISVNLAAKALFALFGSKAEKKLTIEDIITHVAKYFKITVEDIKGSKRVKNIVYPRQIAMYLSRELTDISYPKIGEDFGNKNHTTVMHAYEKIDETIKTDAKIKQDVEELKQQLTHT
ncbi:MULTISPECIES: chromosomal replication initiator protein DnaA [unclassified Facklamia]|uniref:chromosomal replication initiator protein DnaA n=1 Tax=Aerococcaceae TaxID=186827 RepID=UPI0013BAFC50|nr:MULTISPECIES: chromosomal replication initiator protein DnaA [unclassified Facklamia]NEW64951.1 chromosomal replication initiator protein DnaA [Facklamia sp. 252]NEW68412.1 chromosomal replication initiator protein DnaA [Facklamia sp. 253]QQD65551.1 chromosomal replication initiator protein DnaA [Aerococcaceae bacterium zg-252]